MFDSCSLMDIQKERVRLNKGYRRRHGQLTAARSCTDVHVNTKTVLLTGRRANTCRAANETGGHGLPSFLIAGEQHQHPTSTIKTRFSRTFTRQTYPRITLLYYWQ